jgi:hypothetical protein
MLRMKANSVGSFSDINLMSDNDVVSCIILRTNDNEASSSSMLVKDGCNPSHCYSYPEYLFALLVFFLTKKIFLYRCVIAELKKLGKDFSETLALARKLDAAKCVYLICPLFIDMIQHCA